MAIKGFYINGFYNLNYLLFSSSEDHRGDLLILWAIEDT